MKEILKQVEELRLKLVKNFYYICALTLVIGVTALFIAASTYIFLAIFVIIAMVFVVSIIYSSFAKKYRYELKERLLVSCFDSRFKILDHNFKEGIDQSEIENSGLIWLGNRYNSDDYFELEYKGIKIKRADLLIQHVTSNGKTTTTQTIFNGQFMVFTFAKHFKEYIQVREKVFGGVKNNYKAIKSDFHEIDKVKLESIDFNDQFEVFASDGQTAFYLLTPHFMEDLIRLKERTSGQLLIAFNSGQLFLAVNSKINKFEGSLFTECDIDIIRAFEQEVGEIQEFIDSLIKIDEENSRKENE